VLVDPQDGKPPQISDGQQRIATTTIILARIRDLYKVLHQDARATTHIIAVTVLDENQAFRLFETLNDRGVKAGQVDILKNFFLEQSGERKTETHMEWTELTGGIEANFLDDDDQTLLYIRHLWITQNGHTTEKELSAQIRSKISAESLAVNFVSEANQASSDYIALYEPAYAKWNVYKKSTREYLNTINKHLKVEQISADGGTTMILGLMLFPLCGTTAAARSSPTDNMAAPRRDRGGGLQTSPSPTPRGGASN
jgi:hypothetical protein